MTKRQKFTYLELTWHNQFWSVHTYQSIYYTKDENGQDNGKVTDELSCLGREKKKQEALSTGYVYVCVCVYIYMSLFEVNE